MKVNVNDTMKLEKHLEEVNGKATEHTAGSSTIQSQAHFAERTLEDLGVLKKDRIGARVITHSGNDLPRNYRYKVIRTVFTLERGTNAWFLVHAQRINAYPNLPSDNGFVRIPQDTILRAAASKGVISSN